MKPLREQAEERGVTPPTQRTLDAYGLTVDEWLGLLASQDWRCPICLKRNQRWNTDHEHVARWKYMEPEERKRYVRGVLCWHCNHKKVHSHMPAAEVKRIVAYLEAYEKRRGGE